MVSDQEVSDLKDVYELWQTFEIAHEYGPLRGYAPADHQRVQLLWRKFVDPAIKLVMETETKLPDGTILAQAPSPWHAYFFLRAEQQYIFRSGRRLGVEVTADDPPIGDHLFFRGQRCAGWEFQSSLRRKEQTVQESERRAATALAQYFKKMFASNEDLANISGTCFAQHYGIATDFMDITCEPDVAVWFATHPLGAPCSSDEPECMVRAITWTGQYEGSEILVLLPPPFVRNVYQQRGLFIDTSNTSGSLNGKLQLNVRFPRETAGGEFQVIRQGRPLEVWPEPDEHEQMLIQWARTIGAECSDNDDVRKMVQKRRDEKYWPDFWLARELYDFDKHFNEWLSILDWILPATCVTAMPTPPGSPEPMRYEILEQKARALIRANPTLFKAFASAAQGANFPGYFEILRYILQIAREEFNMESELKND